MYGMEISKNIWPNSNLYLYIIFCIFQSVFMSIITFFSFLSQNDLARQVLSSPFYTDEQIKAWRH